jgi:hypothetical protein
MDGLTPSFGFKEEVHDIKKDTLKPGMGSELKFCIPAQLSDRGKFVDTFPAAR